MTDTNTSMPRDVHGQTIPVLAPLTASAIVNFTATPTAATSLNGAEVVLITCTEPCWVELGASGVAVVAATSPAFLCPAGAITLNVADSTHFAVVSAGTDGTICIAVLS